MIWDFIYDGDVLLTALNDDAKDTLKAAIIAAITTEGDFLRLDTHGAHRDVLIDRGIPMYFRVGD